MSSDGTLEAWMNALDFPEVEWVRAEDTASTPAETILSFLCPPGTPNDVKSLVERYKRISTSRNRLFAAPAEPRILEELVWPLRNAKASYVLGNNLAVVALCGMVAEMVAVLLWRLAEPELNRRALTEEDETDLFGRRFDELSQQHRVRILRTYSIVPKDVRRCSTRFA